MVFSKLDKGSHLDLNTSIDGSRNEEFLIENSTNKKAVKQIVKKLSSSSNDVNWRFECSENLLESSSKQENVRNFGEEYELVMKDSIVDAATLVNKSISSNWDQENVFRSQRNFIAAKSQCNSARPSMKRNCVGASESKILGLIRNAKVPKHEQNYQAGMIISGRKDRSRVTKPYFYDKKSVNVGSNYSRNK